MFVFYSSISREVTAEAQYNCLDPGPIPRCLTEVSHMELDFIKRVRPFLKIRKAPNSLGQDRIDGSVVHFVKDIHEVFTFTSNLKLSSLMTDTIVITEHHDNVKTHWNFTLRPTRINTALEWLFWNKFYSDKAPYYSPSFGTRDFTDQIFVTSTSSTCSNWVT